MSKTKPQQFLHVVAVESANVREVEPDGTVLSDVRFVGKQFDSASQSFSVITGGIKLPYTARLVNQLKLGTLLPADEETAHLAGVKYKGQ